MSWGEGAGFEGEGAGLVWSVQELRAVREFGLMGALVGCLPRAPRQNNRLGRPLLLLPEERRTNDNEKNDKNDNEKNDKKEKNDKNDKNEKNDENEKNDKNDNEKERQERQRERQREERREREERQREERQEQREREERQEEAEEGERPLLSLTEEREEQGSEERGKETEERGEEEEEEEGGRRETQVQRWEEFLEQSLEEQRRLALEDRKCVMMSSLSGAALTSAAAALDSFVFPRSALAVQLSTCRQGLPLPPVRRRRGSSEPKGERRRGGEGRGRVFADLRRRGFYLTAGGKFGVDFLVYPGDALRFHAHFMALCVSEGDPLAVRDLLSWVRLSSNVKKTLLLCSPSPPGGVSYSSLQWSSMS
ncbi:LOW QUALITY PROTEIN: tRNA-splicing endonuclease subunit Sen34-like [Boleophthalmus pectinirostris]|uniref:LOW QUALITY PROTEIN: tRNA-splicing endonuclease subunit Sen34-like n=1 Tax=Boleophthalmus pectinirostris TaxID=150288 RepID=UPI00242B88DF|nr:LOW QUALITY PROTEIN: tRNA-splicing endonuclease subunit Sen34-like [Boleophthalmus pectinirostris]